MNKIVGESFNVIELSFVVCKKKIQCNMLNKSNASTWTKLNP